MIQPISLLEHGPTDDRPGDDSGSIGEAGAQLGGTEPDFGDLEPEATWVPRAGRRNLREKLIAGLIGLKHAIRGDSSFFAHAYRAILVGLIAAMLGIDPRGWCLLGLCLGLVLIAELAHSAVDTLARAIGDPDVPPLAVARQIAAAGVLVAVIVSATVSITLLTIKFGELMGWNL